MGFLDPDELASQGDIVVVDKDQKKAMDILWLDAVSYEGLLLFSIFKEFLKLLTLDIYFNSLCTTKFSHWMGERGVS